MGIILDNMTEGLDYCWVDLPSGGEPYPCKKNKIPIRFMTAKDEDLIYSDSPLFIGVRLANACLLDDSIKCEEMCTGDIDAIALALYRNAYKEDALEKTNGWQNNGVPLLSDEDGLYEYIFPDKTVARYRFPTYSDIESTRKNKSRDVDFDFLSKIIVSYKDNPVTLDILRSLPEQYLVKFTRFVFFTEPSIVDEQGQRMVVNSLFFTTKI